MDPEGPAAAGGRRRWSRWIAVAVVVGIISLVIAVVHGVVTYSLGERWGLNSLSIFSVGLSLAAIAITIAIYRRQRDDSKESADQHMELLTQVNRSASRAVQLATTEQMMKTAQQLRHLTPSHTSVHRVARELVGASARDEAPRLLWVDDESESFELEAEILQMSGIDVELAESTEEAMAVLGSATYDAIISDMGRGPDRRAGYDLLERVRSQTAPVPVVFYTGSGDPDHDHEARRKGALGSTNDPVRLFEMVVASLSV